jgi:DNA polymerase-3 subunit epsilon
MDAPAVNSTAAASTIAAYLQTFDASWRSDTPAASVRFVVLDSETTGLDLRRDRVVTIGAVAVNDAQIDLSDVFDALLTIDHNQSSVTVHGVTRDEARGGAGEQEALLEFLGYLRDGVIVGHHIGFDIDMLDAACERHFGITLRNRYIDTMDLTLELDALMPNAADPAQQGYSLDALCARFGVLPRDRHTAAGDAFMTALVFLKLLSVARKAGRCSLGDLFVRGPRLQVDTPASTPAQLPPD